MKFLTSIDNFGRQYQFNIDGGTFRTFIGGILTILMGMATLFLGWYFGQDIYLAESPNVLEKLEYLDYAPVIKNHNYSNTFVAYKIIQDGYDDPRYIEHAMYFKQAVNGTDGITRVKSWAKVEKCSTKFIDNKTLYHNELQNYYCFDTTLVSSFGGQENNGVFSFPTLIMRFCNNDTEKTFNITCATRAEIVKRYTGKKSYVNFVYQGNLILPTDRNYPYRKKFYMREIGIDLLDVKSFYGNIYFREAFINTDIGVIFQEWIEQYFMEYDYMDITLEPPSGDFFAKIYLKVSRAKKSYFRSYIKILDVIANVGGFTSLAVVALQFMYSFYLDNEFSIYLYQKLFKLQIDTDKLEANKDKNIDVSQVIGNESKLDLELGKDTKHSPEENKDGKISKESKEIFNKDNADNQKSPNQENNSEGQNTPKPFLFQKVLNEIHNKSDLILNKELRNVIQFKQRKRLNVEIGRCEKFVFANCCYSKSLNRRSADDKMRYELTIAAERAIELKTEIFELWKSLDQFRLLIKLIVNESQGFMIQNRGRQLITNEVNLKMTGEEIADLELLKLEKQKTKLIAYLENRKKNNQLSELDVLLFRYLDEDIKEGAINEKVNID